MSRLASLLSLKPGEGRMSSFMIGIMLSTAFGAALGGTGIEALFFARFGVDYVGEMSVISREPRMASLVAVGEVRTLCIDQKSFEGLIRERPDVSWSVKQVSTQRLNEASLRK